MLLLASFTCLFDGVRFTFTHARTFQARHYARLHNVAAFSWMILHVCGGFDEMYWGAFCHGAFACGPSALELTCPKAGAAGDGGVGARRACG